MVEALFLFPCHCYTAARVSAFIIEKELLFVDVGLSFCLISNIIR